MQSSVIMTGPRSTVLQKARRAMDILLHIGAHSTLEQELQSYLQINRVALRQRKIAIWGPDRTRRGLFDGLLTSGDSGLLSEKRQRSLGTVRLNCARLAREGVRHLVVCEPNILGNPRDNLRQNTFYPAAAERLVRFMQAFEGYRCDLMLSIRSFDLFWKSAVSKSPMPLQQAATEKTLDFFVTQSRSWKSVVQDMLCAAPKARVLVATHEEFGQCPDQLLGFACQTEVPERRGSERLYGPAVAENEIRFDAYQTAALREKYADDILWLRSHASPKLLLIEKTGASQAKINELDRLTKRGP